MRDIDNAVVAAGVMLPDTVMVGPFSVIKDEVTVGDGAVLGAGCVLGKGARIGAGCVLGNYVTIGDDARLGPGCRVGDHTTVYAHTVMGQNCVVGSNSSVGKPPRPAATSTVKLQADLPPLTVGAEAIIGCSTVLYQGTSLGDKAFVGDCATVRERCLIGNNVVIGSGAAVENDTRIGAFTKIQTGSYITAYMDIGERVFIAPMVTTTNDNFMGRTEKRFALVKGATIGRGARIGGGSILLPRITVAPETFVAAGALVTKDTAAKTVVKGFPARAVRQVPDEELL